MVNTIIGTPHLLSCTPPPLYVAINIAQSMVIPPPPCSAIPHTILVVAISCKGQVGRCDASAAGGRGNGGFAKRRGLYCVMCAGRHEGAMRVLLKAGYANTLIGWALDPLPPFIAHTSVHYIVYPDRPSLLGLYTILLLPILYGV